MGIFDFLKFKPEKKEINSTKFITNGECDTYYNFCGDTSYVTWQENYINSNTDFSNVVFLDWINHTNILEDSFDSYSKFISYDLDIKNPIKKYKDFIKNEYLQKGSLQLILETYKVTDLKKILKENNLKLSGKKAELISRILSQVSIESLQPYIKNNVYELTQKGLDYINKYEYYIKLYKYRNFCIGPIEFDRCLNTFNNDSPNFYDVMIKILDARIHLFKKESSYGLLANTFHNKSIIMKDLGLFDEEFRYLLYVSYIDLSGLCNSNHIYDYEDMIFPHGIAELLFDKKDYFNLNYVDEAFKIDLPFRYFEKDTFINIINDILKGEGVDFDKYKKYANLVSTKLMY